MQSLPDYLHMVLELCIIPLTRTPFPHQAFHPKPGSLQSPLKSSVANLPQGLRLSGNELWDEVSSLPDHLSATIPGALLSSGWRRSTRRFGG